MDVRSQGPMMAGVGERTQRTRTAVRVLLVVLAVLALWGTARKAQFNPTDYVAWQNDWSTVTHCLEAGARPCPGVSKFPLAYLINAGVAHGAQPRDRLALTALNLCALLLPLLALLWLHGSRASVGAIYPYLAALLLSPLPMFYVASGALELQSAVFSGLYLGAFVLVWEGPAQQRRNAAAWLLVLSGLLFPLYKDTLAGMVGAACVGILWLRRHDLAMLLKTSHGRRDAGRAVLLSAAPVLLALFVSVQYNALRYGTPLPFGYMEEARQTLPSWYKSAEFLIGSLASPNGGLLVFWLFPVLAAVAAWRLEGWVPRRTTLVGAGIVLLLSVLAFSRWWAPFGWDSWGDRLLVPPAFALVVAVLVTLRPRPAAGGATGRRRTACTVAVVAVLPLLACSVLYALAPYTAVRGHAMPDSLWTGPACQRLQLALPDQALAEGMAFWKGPVYYACARERMMHIPKPR